LLSSVKYKIFNEGSAIKIKIMAGRMVQTVSKGWFSADALLVRGERINSARQYPTAVMIRTSNNIV
jgi:hypothetical protein